MPLYFLHVTEGNDIFRDAEGIERNDLAAVRKAAIDGMGDLISEAVKRGDCDYEGRLDVEDQDGKKILSLIFACPIRIELASPEDR